MILLNDEPTLVDRLHRTRLVAEVADAIANCSPPQVFGIHGDWGMGKTSFMHQVAWNLVGECPPQPTKAQGASPELSIPKGIYKDRIAVIWFEAWRYQHEDVPVVALLHEICAQLSWKTKFGRQVAKLGEIAVRGALLSLEDLTKKIGIQASKIVEEGERWERGHLATQLPSHTIRAHLTDAISKLIPSTKGNGENKSRLVVLIDDLDRCDAEAAYKLLEGLKIYLTLQNCVFLLGMNEKSIVDAVGKKLAVPGTNDHSNSRAASYLEKLCQNIWRLPTVREPRMLLYSYLPDTIVRDWIAGAIGDTVCLPPNPRKLKGLANLAQRFEHLLPTHGTANDAVIVRSAKILLIVAYVYQFHNDLFLRWEANPKLYFRILDWVRGYKVEYEFLNRLTLPFAVSYDPTSPTPASNIDTAFPDPTDANLFWIQLLIHELGNTVRVEELIPFLNWTRFAEQQDPH